MCARTAWKQYAKGIGMKNRSMIMAIVTLALMATTAFPVRGQGGFFDEVFEPVHHTHFTESGTPFVHPFNFEPPQIHQDAFFIYKYTDNTIDGENEHEAEAHLDWALTKRLGFVLAAPLLGLEDATGTQSAGFGDIEFGPRAMLINQDKFILAANLFMTFPTGDATRDLGAGETVISPYLTTWHDLGNWNTLLFNFGPNIGLESGETSMTYALSLTHSWLGPELLNDDHDIDHSDEGGHQHFPPGMTSLYLEMTGESELGGAERTFIELMPGISYVLTEHAELRFGVLLPVSNMQRFDAQYFTSFTWIN
ncbi:MAG: hypothetical protein H8E66_15885 [Planctomycetes bacterium]|nr:hypothetical protein [Planctomycetota bacterium]